MRAVTGSLQLTLRLRRPSVPLVSCAVLRKVTAEDVLKKPNWPEKWPFYEDDFNRMDETGDGDFYTQPRLVYHIG